MSCWHKWEKWKDKMPLEAVPGYGSDPLTGMERTIVLFRVVQERRCEKCGRVELRTAKAT